MSHLTPSGTTTRVTGLGERLRNRVNNWRRTFTGRPTKRPPANDWTETFAEISLIRPIESITDANEMALVAAGMAMYLIGERGRAMSLSVYDEWTPEQWAQCARAVLATRTGMEDMQRLERIYSARLNPYPHVKDYLNRLTECAFEHVVSAWKGSTMLKDHHAVKRFHATGPSSLLQSYGDKNAAEAMTSVVLSLVSTNVARKIASLDLGRNK